MEILSGYLYVVKQFFLELANSEIYKNIINQIDKLINDTDFSKLYDEKNRLFSIGFNVEENKLTESYYDLLASEARQASYIAIAKRDVSPKHWYNLSRTLTVLNRYKGLISWSGTAFEYLMPNINIPKYPASLLDESCKFMIMSQKEYTRKLNIPWGISESAFNLKDLSNNYQYKAFGIPWLGLKRGLEEDLVVSSYGSMMWLPDEPKEVINNLKILESQGMKSRYGFYEAIDYTPARLEKGKNFEPVKTYMAHHQGLILLSICNLVKDRIVQKRFMQNPEMQSISILLEERMPENVIVAKEKKEKPEKIKYMVEEVYTERMYQKINEKLPISNVISNDNYTIVMGDKGDGYSKYKDVIINRFKKTEEITQGIFFFVKNIKTKRIWTSNYTNYLSKPDKYKIKFTQDKDEIMRLDGSIETITKVCISPNEPVELRSIELKNYGIEEEILEISSFLEPVLSSKEQDYSHMAFNNLFLTYEYIPENGTIIVKRTARDKSKKDMFLAVNLYTQDETIGDLEFEIDKEKFNGRGNLGLPKLIETSSPFTNKIRLTIDPIVAMKRTVKIAPNETKTLHLIIVVNEKREKVLEEIEKFRNEENINRTFKLSKARVEAENRYLGLKGSEIDVYQKMLSYLIFNNPISKYKINTKMDEKYSVYDLWQYGISGDMPILLIKVGNINDVKIVEDLIKAYEYYRLKNIYIDLVIVNEEESSYENYVKDLVEKILFDRDINYLQNQRAGIFILNNLSKEEIKFLEVRADFCLDSHQGNIKLQLKDLEDEYLDTIKTASYEQNKQIVVRDETNGIQENINMNLLKYYNEYGGFSEDGKEYLIKVNKNNRLPNVWSHVIASPKFGTLVTESMGGYTWSKNSRLNRITAWSNNSILDIPSETIFLEDLEKNTKWSLGVNPMPDDNDYYITYGFGYAKYLHNSNNIVQNLTVFVPKEDSIKVNILNLKNTLPRKRKLKLVYYIKPVFGEDEINSNKYINLEFNQKSNMILAKNLSNSDFDDMYYVSSSEKITSFTGDKYFFFGKGHLGNPDGLSAIELNGESKFGNNSIIAIQLQVELEAFEGKEICLLLGEEKTRLECQDKAYQYMKLAHCNEELNKVKRFWNELIGNLQVYTPLESTNILLNGWAIYQTLSCRLWARTGFYQSGGAYGFRDQLQDSMAIKYVDSNITRNQIIKHSEHQFIEGDVEHWWHEETEKGIRTRFSDDLLWLPFVTADYIKFTNDYSILDIKTKYKQGASLEEGIDERYDKYEYSDIEGTIYEHSVKAIEHSFKFGENGLPKIGSGDWNDGFSTVGNKGKGESVWLRILFV